MREKPKLTDWIQSIGLVVGLAVALWQLFIAVGALKKSADANAHAAESNRLSMVASANDLLIQVNLAALQLDLLDPQKIDQTQTGYTPRERLHLLRLQYLDRMHRLYEAELLDESTWLAEQEYARWLAALPSFKEMWTRDPNQPGGALRDHYRTSFRLVVDDAIKSREESGALKSELTGAGSGERSEER